jgi:dolichol-phosphate mannosyltransferase
MKVSVVVPAHNEEGTIVQVLNRLEHALRKLDYEIVVVNDNSTDRTRELVEHVRNSRVKLVNRKPPNGFGRALKDGIKHSKGDIIVFVMADLCDEVEKIPEMVSRIREGYDVVIASRFTKGGAVRNYPSLKLLVNRLCNETIRILYGVPSHDITNSFKAYRAPLIKTLRLQSNGFEILPEIFLEVWKKRVKISEIPTVWTGREAGVSKMRILNAGKNYFKAVVLTRFKK